MTAAEIAANVRILWGDAAADRLAGQVESEGAL